MKKLALIALLISGLTIKAQHDVSLNLLGFAFSKYGIGYEYAINQNNSVGINFNMTSKNMFDDGTDSFGNEMDYSEMNIIPEYKFFLTPNKGNDGVYIGVYGKYRIASTKDIDYTGAVLDMTNPTQLSIVTGTTDVSNTGLSLGAILGYKWQTSGALFLEATAGVGKFIMNNITVDDQDVIDNFVISTYNEDDYTPYIGNTLAVDLRLAVKIGLRFGGGSKE